jgi:hypothetical protein
MNKEKEEAVKYHKVIGTYLQMFNPQQCELEISSLEPMPENDEINGPLKFDEAYQRLVQVIKAVGQNRDALVFRKDADTYWIIDGVRVTHAMKDAGFTHATCTVLDVDYQRGFEISQVLNSAGHRRRETFQMKAKKLELLEKHAKSYLMETRSGDNEQSQQTVRQYMATILGMCERYVSDFQHICHHSESNRLLGEMDKGLISMHKAAAIAKNKHATLPPSKQSFPVGRQAVLTCSECPRRKEFLDKIDQYDDSSSDEQHQEESEVHNA